jgi:hypothetical protein
MTNQEPPPKIPSVVLGLIKTTPSGPWSKSHLAVAAYRAGLKKAAWWLAVHRDGQQLVGVTEKPLADVNAAIDRGEWD